MYQTSLFILTNTSICSRNRTYFLKVDESLSKSNLIFEKKESLDCVRMSR